eukprot:979629-Amphidinium_carterae.1
MGYLAEVGRSSVDLYTSCPNEQYSEVSVELLKTHSVPKTRSKTTNPSGHLRAGAETGLVP